MTRRFTPRASPPPQTPAPYDLAQAVQEFQHKYAENVVRLADGDIEQAAALLGITPQKTRRLISQAPQHQLTHSAYHAQGATS